MSNSIPELTQRNSYDNSITYLYKQAINLSVPVRFVLIKPTVNLRMKHVDTFDLNDDEEVEFITVFDYIKNKVKANPTIKLIDIWNILKNTRGDQFNALDLLSIWFHTFPEYSEEDTERLEEINDYLISITEISKHSIYISIREIINKYYQKWKIQYAEEYHKDFNILLDYIKYQQELINIVPAQHSPLDIDMVSVNYIYPTENGTDLLPDIFNNSKTSLVIPYIQYNVVSTNSYAETVNRYYKIFKPYQSIDNINYANVIPKTTEIYKEKTIYYNIWNQEYTNDEVIYRNSTKESYDLSSITYLPDLGILKVTITSPYTDKINEWTMIERFHEHVKILKFPDKDNLQETKISGSFYIYNIFLNEHILFHMLTNDKLFNTYLYLEEMKKSFAEKNQITIYYRGTSVSDKNKNKVKSMASANITANILSSGSVIKILTPTGSSDYVLETDTYVIKIKITKALNRKVTDQFIDILTKLFGKYLLQDVRQHIYNMYIKIIPESGESFEKGFMYQSPVKLDIQTPTKLIKHTVSSKSDGKLKNLKNQFPIIFKYEYSRDCQKPYQPIIIPNSEKDNYEYVLPYPHKDMDKPFLFYFGCSQDSVYKYPGYVFANVYHKKDQYPYLPCCYKTTGNMELKENTKVTTKPNVKNSYIFSSEKILDSYRLGELLSPQVENFLQLYNDGRGKFMRYGVPKSINSFIHCVALALDPQYSESINKEDYVVKIRKILSDPDNGYYPEVLKQELYDYSIDEIHKLLLDPNEYFDPLKYYRILEIYYECNIYIFTLNEFNKEHKQKTSLLQLPRHKYFYVKSKSNYNNTVLIVRNLGTSADFLINPQSELIINQDSNDITFWFDQRMNDLLYNGFQFVSRTLIWQIENDTFNCYENMYSSISYTGMFKNMKIYGQIIDNSGKTRMFASKHGNTHPYIIYMCVPPTAPLNIPSFDIDTIDPSKLPSYSKIMKLFDSTNLISVTLSPTQDNITGLWYTMGDITYGLYFPCKDYSWKKFHKSYPNITHNIELLSLTIQIPRYSFISPIQRITILEKSASFIEQIVKYLYLVSVETKYSTISTQILPCLSSIDTVSLFLTDICVMNTSSTDSLQIYNMSQINRILPIGTVPQILAELCTQVPLVFPDNTLLLYDFLMCQSLYYKLNKFIRSIAKLDIKAIDLRQLKDYYKNKSDFNFNPHTEYFLTSLNEFNDWYTIHVKTSNDQQRLFQKLGHTIQTHIDPNSFPYKEPYIYQISDNSSNLISLNPLNDKFYLIQNVAEGNYKRAINVADTWNNQKLNLGFLADEYQDILPVHMIYSLTSSRHIIIDIDRTEKHSTYLHILRYPSNFYSALLPILSNNNY